MEFVEHYNAINGDYEKFVELIHNPYTRKSDLALFGNIRNAIELHKEYRDK